MHTPTLELNYLHWMMFRFQFGDGKQQNEKISPLHLPNFFFMKIRLHEHPLSKKISRTVDPSHERSICISASPIVRLKQTEREIQLIISSSPSMNCPSKKSSPETQSRKEEHSRARKNKRKFNEKTVTLPSNQNTQRHQSSQRKSRTSESRQISSKFLPQLGFVSRFDSSSRLLSRGGGAFPVCREDCGGAGGGQPQEMFCRVKTGPAANTLGALWILDSANRLAALASNALKTRGQTFRLFFFRFS